jgi:hypothetical protein
MLFGRVDVAVRSSPQKRRDFALAFKPEKRFDVVAELVREIRERNYERQ